mgnify:FL=1|jgi:hypothetical protein
MFDNKFLFVLVMLMVPVFDAQAYLDMGTGSYIIQGLLAGAFAGIYAVKAYWLRIRIFLSKFFGKNEGSE